jgi:hypothetical protein
MDDEPSGVKSVVLNEGDRELVWMAARLLMAQEPGRVRMDGVDRFAEHYRSDLGEAHPGVDAATLDEMAVNFTGALLLEMERWADEKAGDDEFKALRLRSASLPARPRVIAAIGQMLGALDPRH